VRLTTGIPQAKSGKSFVGRPRDHRKIFLDRAGDVAYNPPIMDSLNDFRIAAEALSSLLSWNWWAASPAQ